MDKWLNHDWVSDDKFLYALLLLVVFSYLTYLTKNRNEKTKD